jgi:hypothetical protein
MGVGWRPRSAGGARLGFAAGLVCGGVLVGAEGGETRSLGVQPFLVCVPSDLRVALVQAWDVDVVSGLLGPGEQ